MTRAEWRTPYWPGQVRPGSVLTSPLKSRSTLSLGSGPSDLPADTLLCNIENIYVQNLMLQMTYVIEKVSSRIIPASLIAFCGKTLAYAFFFCKGIGEKLVRQWKIRPETLTRVFSETNKEEVIDLTSCSQYVSAGFPSALRGLSFTSLKSMVRHLRSQPELPTTAVQIPSHEPWVGRWAGRDTDLFFAFCKCYYHLAAQFLPPTASPSERLCAPGYILLQAQLLTIFDASIQRGDSLTSLTPSLSPFQSDKRLENVDASANILPNGSAVTRSMAESRIILLLRECLSGPISPVEAVRKMFAESFELLLKAAARRTSLFDHHACFSLCDFMEEAITILARYKTSSTSDSLPLDWSFWLTVCRRMVASQNTMTEIRLYAFLYGMWGTLAGEKGCKSELCLGWLLDEKYFQQKFGHWCPMVRAYYMRLLCWRIGRLDKTASELDATISTTLVCRLQAAWEGVLAYQHQSLNGACPTLSTTPCSPAPRRHFIIVRNDSQPTNGNRFLTFDSILSSGPPAEVIHKSNGSLGPGPAQDVTREPDSRKSLSGKSWARLKNMLPFTTPSKDVSRESSGFDRIQQAHGRTLRAPTNAGPSSKQSTRSETVTCQLRSFKFSLEWTDMRLNRHATEQRLHQPRLPMDREQSGESRSFSQHELELCEPKSLVQNVTKYSGQALAEWNLIVAECQGFLRKRRAEGVPNDFLVETPTLGVEVLR
ncbi:MAG: hypothetical protein Q9183_000423 [Haloplaca sp. 2 TL-2023]